MNQILKIMSLGGLIAITTPAFSEECAHGMGTIVEAKDHRRYCMSKVAMNWWSAFAWCDAAGGKLVSTQDCVYTGDDASGNCPNLNVTTNYFWTSTQGETSDRACIFKTSRLTCNADVETIKTRKNSALCRGSY